jgi:hypothetical protein
MLPLVQETRCEQCGSVRFDGPTTCRCKAIADFNNQQTQKGTKKMKITETTEAITRGRQKAENTFLAGETVTLTAKAVKDGGYPEALSGSDVPKAILPFLSGKTYTIEVSDGEKPFTIINQMREAADTVKMKVSVAPAAGVSAKVDSSTKAFRVKWSVKTPKPAAG